MDNDLVSIYENAYLRGNVVEEKKNPFFQKEDEDTDDAPKKSFKKKGKFVAKKGKKKKSMSKAEIGGITYDSFNRSETVFDKILREMNEMGEGVTGAESVGDDNNVFDTGDDYDLDEGEQSYTLSELRSMTLGEIVDLISGGEDEYETEDLGEGEYEDDLSEEDDIPQESYGFTGGEGNYQGSQGTYDGKAKRQPATRFVKANGDAEFGEAETDYDPEEIDGNEESNYKGDQGTYDGKAKRQSPTNFVKSNGDADFGKVKTGYKTSSGKKEKNYF